MTQDDSKPCQWEYEGTEGSQQVHTLAGVNSRTSLRMLSHCKRLTSFAQLTLGCWIMTLLFFQHTGAVTPHWLGFQGRLGRHARLRLLQQWSGRNGFARFLLLWVSPPVLESRRGVDGQHWSQTVSADPCWLRRGQCWSSVERWETGGVSHDPSCGPNGDLEDAKERIVWQCKLFSLRSDSFL